MNAYRIHIRSGDQGDGSDTNVSITVTGDKGFFHTALDRTNALTQKGRLFHPKSDSVFEVKHKGSLGNIDLLEVNHDASSHVDWYVESISVEDMTLNTLYEFPCNKWFSETKEDCRQSRVFVERKILDRSKYESQAKGGVVLLQQAGLVKLTLKQTEDTFSQMKSLTLGKSAAEVATEIIKTFGIQKSFTNWGGNVTVTSLFAFFPWRLWQVKAIIVCARIAGMKVRAIGATHSWTELYPNEATVLINPALMMPESGSKPIEYNSANATVKVLCNVTTFRIKQDQLKEKYNFMFNTILGGVTYGGIIGTGCHGVGKDCPAHPDLIEEIEIVNSDGLLVTYKKSEKPELVKAVGTSMGLFGFMYTVTLKVHPREYIVEMHNSFNYKVGDTLLKGDALKTIVERNFSTEIFWFPFNSAPLAVVEDTDKVEFAKSLIGQVAGGISCLNLGSRETWNPLNDELLIKEVNMKPGETPQGELYYDVKLAKEYIQTKLTKNAPEWLANYPWLTPLFTSLTNCSQKSCKIPGTNIELGEPTRIVQQLPRAISYRFWVHQGFTVYDLEFAHVVNDDYENIATACQDVVDLVTEYANKKEYPMSLALEMRFMSDSKSYLCPAVVGNGKPAGDSIKVAYVEVLALGSLQTRPKWVEFAQRVAEKWMAVDGVKPLPHWGKASELPATPQFVKYLWDNNGENMQNFLDQLEVSGADPDRIFFNEYLETVLNNPSKL